MNDGFLGNTVELVDSSVQVGYLPGVDEDEGPVSYASAADLGFFFNPELDEDFDFFATSTPIDPSLATAPSAEDGVLEWSVEEAEAPTSPPPPPLSSMVPDGDRPEPMLAMVMATRPAGSYYASATRRPDGRFVNTHHTQLAALIADNLSASAQGQDAYYAMAAFEQPTYIGADGKYRFRTQANALGASCYWADWDVGPDKATSGEGYATREAAWAALCTCCEQSGLPVPNVVVNSGRGLHTYWTQKEFISKLKWDIQARKLKKLFRCHGRTGHDPGACWDGQNAKEQSMVAQTPMRRLRPMPGEEIRVRGLIRTPYPQDR